MSWLFSRALAEAYLAAYCSGGKPCAPSNSTDTPQAFWSPGKTTDTCPRFQSGMTCEPLTATHGEALLTWFREASRARTSVSQERARESAANAPGCGGKWRELFVRYDRATSSWKTRQCLWEEEVAASSVTLPKWGMMRRGVLLEPTTSARLTSATASGYLHSFPTPTVCQGPYSKAHTKGPKSLEEVAQTDWLPGRPWPTPHAGCGTGASWQAGRRGAPNLQTMVQMFPTPTASEHKYRLHGDSQQSHSLGAMAVKLWRTPDTGAGGNSGLLKQGITKRENGQSVQVRLQDQVGGQLNPLWVEWLMGWPAGWTGLKPLEMGKFRQWLRSHGACCTKGLKEEDYK